MNKYLVIAAFLHVAVGCTPVQSLAAPEGSKERSNVAMLGVGALESSSHRENFAMLQYTPDPIEGFNRGSFGVTKFFVDWGLKPIGKGWRFLTPDPVRRSVDNFGYNLSWPSRFVALLLQGRARDSAVETGHFLVNSTVGVAGLFDPASRFGIGTHRADVGQAFARWGAGPGFYFMIPFLGPSSGRDTLGRVFDMALDPATYYLPGARAFLNMNAFTFRIDGYEALTRSEQDLYLPVRALWSIQRTVEVEDYTIPESAYAASDPEPSLGVLLFKPKDRDFPTRRKELRVAVPATGKELPYSLWLQDGAAPLLYLIPGIGGHRSSTASVALAELAFDAGYSVAVVSSVFHPEFLVPGLEVPYPGNTPRDVESVYQVLSAIQTDIETRRPGSVTSSSLLGYSLGAIESLFLASQQGDRPRDALRFERIVALNPPVDLMHAARKLDSYFDAPLRWPAGERDARVMEVGLKGFLVAQEGVNGERPLPFDRTESEFLVGLSFRDTLVNTLAAIEERTGETLAKTAANDPSRGALLETVNRSSLESYGEQLVVPHYLEAAKGAATRDSLVFDAGLRAKEKALSSDARVRVLTNADDFLLRPEDLHWLRETFGGRLRVFPDGGHLGNLHRPEVQSAVVEALTSAPEVAQPKSERNLRPVSQDPLQDAMGSLSRKVSLEQRVQGEIR